MQKSITEEMLAFWISVMERLNDQEELYRPIPDILRDTCDFFDFGCGFIYQANYASTFFLRESYILYQHNHLQDPIDMTRAAGAEMLAQLARDKSVLYSSQQPGDSLQQCFAGIFQAKSLVLVPVISQEGRIIAMVGLADRRAQSRKRSRNPAFVYSILSALATRVRLQMYHDRILQTQETLQNMVDNTGVDMYAVDFYTREILFANRTAAAPFGAPESLLGKPCWTIMATGQSGPCSFCPQPLLIDGFGKPTRVHTWEHYRQHDDTWHHMVSSAFPWVDGRLAHVVGSIDISENKRNEALIRDMAEYDALTGLYNRRRLMQDMEAHLAMLRQAGEGFVLFFDLDGFKQVNDTLGHHIGDALLRAVAQLLKSHPDTQDKCYRNGGDEFVLLYPNCTLAQLQPLLTWLNEAFSRPLQVENEALVCGTSIGVAHYPHDATDANSLLQRADAAMYTGKQQGGGQVHFYNRGKVCPPAAYYAQIEA
ncbi:GGDEF domain-containing protein [Ruminococcaceae bacterium OttesenSCG-928-O06]|nr:GGDEF domain-containing protein [Ruminococcaceae bacterium OttesenSCG-928-O06]